MKLSTLLIGASAILVASFTQAAIANQNAVAQIANQTTQTYTVVCLNWRNGEEVFRRDYQNRDYAHKQMSICSNAGLIPILLPVSR
ncbi:hypothetical protein ACSLBF_18430 (plasmid) [Pseudoalteromonas sp. T1lg65]|uniref:hypothetical protein n=1 Tax=Pseudoalteromonas sp. T1lg65 TaxID=2077101 RepID=UPI003F78B036